MSIYGTGYDGRAKPIRSDNDGVILQSPWQQPHNRYITGVGSTQAAIGHLTWTEAEDVHRVRFKVGGGSAGDLLRVVFDASPVDDTSNDTQALNWLQQAGSDEATDVEYFEIVQGGAGTGLYIPEFTDYFEFAGPLRRADIIANSGSGYTVFAEVS